MEKDDEIVQTVKEILEVRRQHPNRLNSAGTQIVKADLRRLKELDLSNGESDNGQT